MRLIRALRNLTMASLGKYLLFTTSFIGPTLPPVMSNNNFVAH